MKKSDISALNIAAHTLHTLVLVITHERKHPSGPSQMRESLEALLALAGDLHKVAAKHLTGLDNGPRVDFEEWCARARAELDEIKRAKADAGAKPPSVDFDDDLRDAGTD